MFDGATFHKISESEKLSILKRLILAKNARVRELSAEKSDLRAALAQARLLQRATTEEGVYTGDWIVEEHLLTGHELSHEVLPFGDVNFAWEAGTYEEAAEIARDARLPLELLPEQLRRDAGMGGRVVPYYLITKMDSFGNCIPGEGPPPYATLYVNGQWFEFEKPTNMELVEQRALEMSNAWWT
jgi:hypothetical protein